MRALTHTVQCGLTLLCLITLMGCESASDPSGTLQVNGYTFDFTGERVTRNEEGKIAADVKTIVVENRFGAVAIATGEEEPRWEWEISCWADTAVVAKQYTSRVICEVDSHNGRHSWKLVIPEPPVDDLRGVISNVALLVPPGVHVELSNSHGDNKIHGVTGSTTARCQFGNLGLFNLGGHVDATLAHGDLTGNDLPGCVITNRHGDLTVTGVDGELKITSSHGDVTLDDVKLDVEVKNSFGGVNALDVAQNLRVRNDHGAVHVERVAGAVDVMTTFSKMEVKDVSGHLLLRNQFGDVVVHGGDKVDVATKFGAIQIASTAAEIRCRNEHGKIAIRCLSSTFQYIDAETSFGDLEVHVPSGLKPTIQAATKFGKVKSEFPVLDLKSGANNFSDLAADAPRMTLKTTHGDIRVSQ